MKRPVKPLVVIADDDAEVLRWVDSHQRSWNCRLVSATNEKELLRQLDREIPSLLLLDLSFSKENGIELMHRLLRDHPSMTVVLLTDEKTVEKAASAIDLGAFDYLVKPHGLDRLPALVRNIEEKRALVERVRDLEPQVDEQRGLWGESEVMRNLRALIASVAPTDANVLILGESGAGKEVVARTVHHQSVRRRGPFVPVNMVALPRDLVESTLFGQERAAAADQPHIGCCEAADEGTLFLDQIGEMDLPLQAKLLRFLQERTIQRVGGSQTKKVNVRVVAASSQDLRERIRAGLFREDLYYRLNVVPLVVAPLRAHLEDVPLLASRFLQRASLKYGKPAPSFTREALDAMSRYPWHGNVRQLENLVERYVILGNPAEIALRDLPTDFLGKDRSWQTPVPRPLAAGSNRPGQVSPVTGAEIPTIEEMEKKAIFDALNITRGNVREAARLLGYGQATVYRKIKKFGILLEDLGRTPSQVAPELQTD